MLTGAINTKAAINKVAINTLAATRHRAEVEVAAIDPAKTIASERGEIPPAGTRTGNRRERETYNEYMREYMRRKRKGFIGIAYG